MDYESEVTCPDCGWQGEYQDAVPGYLLDEYGDIAGNKLACPDCGHNIRETYD